MSETPDMVERVARTLAGKHYADRFSKPVDDPHVHANVDGNWHTFAGGARAAIEAMREPELQMVQAACDATFGPIPLSPEAAHMIGWRAMIDAALTQPTE